MWKQPDTLWSPFSLSVWWWVFVWNRNYCQFLFSLPTSVPLPVIKMLVDYVHPIFGTNIFLIEIKYLLRVKMCLLSSDMHRVYMQYTSSYRKDNGATHSNKDFVFIALLILPCHNHCVRICCFTDMSQVEWQQRSFFSDILIVIWEKNWKSVLESGCLKHRWGGDKEGTAGTYQEGVTNAQWMHLYKGNLHNIIHTHLHTSCYFLHNSQSFAHLHLHVVLL